jgi:hypothetical protein
MIQLRLHLSTQLLHPLRSIFGLKIRAISADFVRVTALTQSSVTKNPFEGPRVSITAVTATHRHGICRWSSYKPTSYKPPVTSLPVTRLSLVQLQLEAYQLQASSYKPPVTSWSSYKPTIGNLKSCRGARPEHPEQSVSALPPCKDRHLDVPISRLTSTVTFPGAWSRPSR